jgi:alkylation response protein AidB-like acyl-CoA dehydrogenase
MGKGTDGSQSPADVRAGTDAWLDEHWRPDRPRREWLALVVDAGYAAPRWPREWYGRGLDGDDARVVEECFARRHAPGPGQDRLNLWANTVLAHGRDELKRRVLRPLLLGELGMCLLYSEPGAGSDLAGLQTSAVRDGDEWVVNGQKVWTSGALEADYALLIARTDWDAPKHRGITFFFFPMRQPGVEVRPLRQITGDSRFNEVFLTDTRVPDGNRLGELNQGWWVLQTALAYERTVMGVALREGSEPRPDTSGTGDEHEVRSPGTRPAPIPRPDLSLVALARATGRSHEPTIRQALARLHCLRTVNEWNEQRARAELRQGTSSPLASLGKLAMSGILHTAGRLQALILGAEATLDGPEHRRAADAGYSHLNAYFTSIGGGTDQIQRNIIGERILGLPREPEPDKGRPFREVRQAVAADRPR